MALGASLAAMLAGWIIDDVFQPFLGTGPALVLSFAGSTVAFFFARETPNALARPELAEQSQELGEEEPLG